MKITLEQQEHYIDTCVRRYNDGKLTKEQAINRINNMGRMVPELREYAQDTVASIGDVEPETNSTMLDYLHN